MPLQTPSCSQGRLLYYTLRLAAHVKAVAQTSPGGTSDDRCQTLYVSTNVVQVWHNQHAQPLQDSKQH